MGFGECDCPEARLLRSLVEVLDSPEGMLDRLASTYAVWKLRAMSHELAGANDWTRWSLPYAQRYQYDTPTRTVEEMHADVAASWERWYRTRDTAWLTAVVESGPPDSNEVRVCRRILRERS